MPFLGQSFDITPLDKKYGIPKEAFEDNTRGIVFGTGEPKTTAEAKTETTASYESILRRGYAEGRSLDEIRAEALELGVKQEEFQKAQDYHLEYALSLNKNDVSSTEVRYRTNLGVAKDMISQAKYDIRLNKGSGRRGVDAALMFVRDILPLGPTTWEGLGNTREELSMEIQKAAINMQPDEFKQWFKVKVDEFNSRGLFLTSDTVSAQNELEGIVGMEGSNPNQGFEFFLSAIDVIDVGAGGVAVAASRRAAKATTMTGKAAAIGNVEEVAEKAAVAVEKNADPEVAANIGIKALDPAPVPETSPLPSNVLASKAGENHIVKEITRRNRSNTFGKFLEPADLDALKAKVVARFRNRKTDPVYNADLTVSDIGRAVVKVQIGKALPGKTSKPFQYTKAGNIPKAQQALIDQTGGKAVPVGKKGFVIEVEEAVNPEDVIKGFNAPSQLPTDISGLGAKIKNKLGAVLSALLDNPILGSSRLRDIEEFTTLKQMTEAGYAGVKEFVEPELKKLKRLRPKERSALSRVLGELREGADAGLKSHYGPVEFSVKYRQMHPDGEPPSQQAIEAYEAAVALEEADYVFAAYNSYSRALRKGFSQTIEPSDGFFVPAKRVTRENIPEDAKVWDGKTSAKLRVGDFPEDATFWRHMFVGEDGQEFTVAPVSVRALSPEDVLGFNPGGRRTNPFHRFYVNISDGRKRIKSLLGTFSETEARRAALEIGNIKRAVNEGSLTDDVIQANNSWNPNLQTVDDWNSLGFRVEGGDIHYAKRDADVLSLEEDPDSFWSGTPMDEFVRIQQSRNDEVLMSYGGAKSYQEDPVNTILSSFGSTLNTYTNRLYTANVMKGWIETALTKGRKDWFDSSVSKSDWYSMFMNAQVKGTDEFAIRMRELREIALRRNGLKDPASSFMEELGSKVGEFVFDLPLGQSFHRYMTMKGGVEGTLLHIAFQSAFGFLNMSQFFVQGYHSLVISAVTMDPFASVAPFIFRPMMHKMHDPAVLAEAVKRKAKFWGMKEEDIYELLEYYKTSGRTVVEGDAIEAGTGVGWGISGWGGESFKYSNMKGAANRAAKYGGMALDIGLTPFRSGERFSRMTAIAAAWREFKAKNPGVSALSAEGRAWITRREQDLSLNMTNSSRAMAQSGVWKVPTQWMSYPLRAMEAVFVGRGLTGAERARMAATMAPMFGLSGFGLEFAADQIAETFGIEDPNLYVFLRDGLLDGLGYAMVGKDAPAVGKRLAPVQAIKEVYNKITEESTISAAFGPAGEITGGILSAGTDAVMSALYGIQTGEYAPLTEDLVRMLRQPSGIDTKAKAWGIFSTGTLQTKNGYVYGDGWSTNAGLTQLMGFTPIGVNEEMYRNNQQYMTDKEFRRIARDLDKRAEVAFQYFKEENYDKGTELLNRLQYEIDYSGMSPSQRLQLKRSIGRPMTDSYFKIMKNLMDKGDLQGAKMFERISDRG